MKLRVKITACYKERKCESCQELVGTMLLRGVAHQNDVLTLAQEKTEKNGMHCASLYTRAGTQRGWKLKEAGFVACFVELG